MYAENRMILSDTSFTLNGSPEKLLSSTDKLVVVMHSITNLSNFLRKQVSEAFWINFYSSLSYTFPYLT